MGNVLSKEKREQVVVLGRLGWALRRIEKATGVRRETAGEYLRSAGIKVRSPGGWGRRSSARAATVVTTDSEGSKPATQRKPANEVTTDSASSTGPATRSFSAAEPYRERIVQELSRGRNAIGIWQDLVDEQGFAAANRLSSAWCASCAGLNHRTHGSSLKPCLAKRRK
jgi:hypothetical protein